MYAIKEAVIAKEHSGGDLDCAVFFMDMRTPGKDFERFYNNAKENQGVRFLRSRVHTIDPVGNSGDLSVRYVTENGELQTDIYNMVVLSVGMQTPSEVADLAQRLVPLRRRLCLNDRAQVHALVDQCLHVVARLDQEIPVVLQIGARCQRPVAGDDMR